jgi:enoyl-CoA hydratase
MAVGRPADGVACITIDGIGPRNALGPTVLADLADALATLDRDPTVRCGVLVGAGGTFAAGADLKWMAEQDLESMLDYAGGSWATIRAAALPLIAAVEGYALGGGCELALCCDLLVAAEGACFGLPEVGLGLIPGAGGTQRLARALGHQRASELVLTARRWSAAEAHELGLVARLRPDGEAEAGALELAAELAAQPRQATRLAKRALRAAEEMPQTAALEHERRLFELAFGTTEASERIAAFAARGRRRD